MKKTLIAFLLAAVPTFAFAAQESQLALAEGDFAEQRAEIEEDLADGKTYAEINNRDRAEVREALDRISRELEGVDSVAELAEPAKVTVFNEQERINTILTQAKADSRLVCDHSRPTGSHRRVTKCQTVAERRRRMEADQDHLQRNIQNGIGPANN
ncbi:hypothetical protein [Arenimonas donghaensis]|uniref:Uncharacterized protein n=1 Tax=Arenimonas donghaensis DSM 18148 = HO3-R19 TaxID=1121014 RepID=A0A087MFX8_9GAMM|nr:hypothetical protein [Arenimonas donghaensis]KFL35781.1 hypothetical protein N788_06970 [Arenimonas donghaensis DSM 18148 = HO3-R19]